MSNLSPEFSVAALSTLERPDNPKRWQLIMKLVGPCNLNCDYCYVYNKTDSSWRDMPKVMPGEIVAQVAERIAAHYAEDDESAFEITLHGGEPLMMGYERLAETLRVLKAAAPEAVSFGIQTNATLLNQKILDLFSQYDVSVGVSLDGPQAANDLHRLYRDGRSSYESAMRGISLLNTQQNKHLFSGILSVIDVRTHPEDTYNHLAALSPPAMDLLLPHGNWDDLPLGKENLSYTPYAHWLIRVFNKWYTQPVAERPAIRTFQSIMRVLMGKGTLVESMGLAPVREITIQPNGAYEKVDTLQSAFHGAAHLGMRVTEHMLSEVMAHPEVRVRTLGATALWESLSPICHSCPKPIAEVCGGGYEPHRYSSQNGFENPSVYCFDLAELIVHIGATMRGHQLNALVRHNAGDLNRLLRNGEAF